MDWLLSLLFYYTSNTQAVMLPTTTGEPTIRQLFEHAQILTLRNAFIIAPILYAAFYLIHTLFIPRQRKIPGPFLARITGLWELKKVVDGDLHKTMVKLHKQYGKIPYPQP